MATPAGGGCPPPLANHHPPGRSFVDVAKGISDPPLTSGQYGSKDDNMGQYGAKECIFPSIQLAARQYRIKEGKPVISFTTSEFQVGEDHLKHALVAKFTGGRPVISEVRQSFMQLWAINGRCSIGALDAKHILIVLESENDARTVLAHPIRKLGHSPFRIFRWSWDFSTKREATTTTNWIRLDNLPPVLNNPGYIESIVAAFAKYLAVDIRTRTFTNPNYARVCIEIDSTQTLPEEVWIATGSESGYWQRIIYENTLQYCTKCHLHGHSLRNCRKHKQRQETEQLLWEAHDDFGLVKSLITGTQPQTKDKQAADWETDQKWKKNKNYVPQIQKPTGPLHQIRNAPSEVPCKPQHSISQDSKPSEDGTQGWTLPVA
ncbi:hypothetical protein QQ045_023255 [Rhodiola kirilowii]